MSVFLDDRRKTGAGKRKKGEKDMENPTEPRPFSVSPEAAEEYESSLERLLSEMDREMEAEPEIDRLVGGAACDDETESSPPRAVHGQRFSPE